MSNLNLSVGLTFLALAGCQSYFPHSYGGAGAYPVVNPGAYTPSGAVTQPNRSAVRGPVGQPATGAVGNSPTFNTPAGGTSAPAGSLKDQKLVPRYPNPDSTPPDLGAPGEADSIKRSSSFKQDEPNLLEEAAEGGAALASFEEPFRAPRQVRAAAAGGEPEDLPRATRKATTSPFKRPRSGGYEWLRGIAQYERKTGTWRLQYSEDGRDAYGGILPLVGLENVKSGDCLMEGDVVLVEGQIAHAEGRPAYRVQKLLLLKPED